MIEAIFCRRILIYDTAQNRKLVIDTRSSPENQLLVVDL